MRAALPSNEIQRINALHKYNILDTLPEQEYQDIAFLASLICETPIAVVSLVDNDRQWFKAKVGVDAVETGRDIAFCAHALLEPDAMLLVPDATRDARFFDNPLVTGGLNIHFYAGAPLVTQDGLALGTLCVLDHVPRQLTDVQREALTALSRQVMAQLERRHQISLLQDAQAQLLQSEKMASIGQLAAGVAHEINNPVAFVSSNMNMLGDYSTSLFDLIERHRTILAGEQISAQGREKMAAAEAEVELDYIKQDLFELVKESRDGLNRVRDIVQALKDFSHVDSADWQFADLHSGIDNTLKIVANEIRHKAEIIREYGVLPQVQCLPSQLNQVFMNLLVNAAHAVTQTGVIKIASMADADWIRISISDNGAGIAPEHLVHIFEPFFTTKPIGLGTGLGLSVSYNIVKKHGGQITVVSEPGKGSTFTVCLPILSPECTAHAEQSIQENALQREQQVVPT